MKASAESEGTQPASAEDALAPDDGPEPGPRRRPLAAVALRLLSDERLVRLAANGDRLAFAAIFDRYHQELYAYCASLLRDREDAADALQSTMLRALRALDGEQREIAVRPWLYRIAHNESITLLRRPRAESSPDESVAVLADVETSAAVRAHLRTLLQDIQELPERQRGALVMRELAGLGYDEIAAALDTSPAGAKQAVYDARRALFELEKGRDTDCEAVRRRLSDGDRRFARARTIRAHLSACTGCRSFQAQVAARESSLGAFAPAVPAAAAAQAFHGALGGAAASTFAGTGTTAAASQAAAAVAVAVALGASAVGVNELRDREDKPARPRASMQRAPVSSGAPAGDPRGRAARRAARATGERRARIADRRRASAADRKRADRADRRRAGRSDDEKASQTRDAGAAGDLGGGAGVPAPSAGESSGRGGRIGSLVRPGGGSRSEDPGPVQDAVDDVRGTVGQVQDALPVPAPEVRIPPVRPPR